MSYLDNTYRNLDDKDDFGSIRSRVVYEKRGDDLVRATQQRRPTMNFALADFEFDPFTYRGYSWVDVEVFKIPESKDFSVSTPGGIWRCKGKGEGWKFYDS